MGRRKIEMKMVKDNNSRQVTFSKRRTGLFKKANELAIMCGAAVAIVVFSPGGKPFSFGNPDVETITNRFLNQEAKSKDHDHHEIENLNHQLIGLVREIQAEKKKEIMKFKAKLPINELSLKELLKLKVSLEKVGENIKAQFNEFDASSSLLLLANKPVVVETDN